jgi:hypothetical protein
MKALILNNKVVDVKEVEFEVPNTMVWVNCSNDIKIGYRYDGTNFISNLPTAEQIAEYEQEKLLKEQNKQSALNKLKALGLNDAEIKAITGL